MKKDNPIVEAIIIVLMFAMAVAGFHAPIGCASIKPSSSAYPLTQPIDPVTEEVINVSE